MEGRNEKRLEDMSSLQSFIGQVDMEITMLLQHLQWDKNSLIQKPKMVKCKYNTSHNMPNEAISSHEDQCYLRCNGYSKDDLLLPDPASHRGVLIKLGRKDIQHIINNAAELDPSLKRGKNVRSANTNSKYLIKLNFLGLELISFIYCTGNDGVEPLTIERLQSTYSGDERRAIHDAVVKLAPSCHDLTDLALPSDESNNEKNPKVKSRVEILAELRDMKRRRTKYRVAAKTRNYSDILRDVIKTQMEVYSDAQRQGLKETLIKKKNEPKTDNNHKESGSKDRSSRHYHKRYSPIKKIVKQEKYCFVEDTSGTKRKCESHLEYTERYSNKNRSRNVDEDLSHKKSSDHDRERHREKYYEHSLESQYASSKRRKYKDEQQTNHQRASKIKIEDNDYHGTDNYSFKESKSKECDDRYKYRHHFDRTRDKSKGHKSNELYKYDKYSSNESSRRENKYVHKRNNDANDRSHYHRN